MLEVLIAVFVLALGVIGAAGMQLAATRTTQQASYQSIAFQLASELADKMRASDSQMKLHDGANVFLNLKYDTSEGEPAPLSKDCYVADCSALELAEFGIHDWKKRLRSSLPGGRVAVCRDQLPWDAAQKRLRWECMHDGSSTTILVKVGWHIKNPAGDSSGLSNSSPGLALAVSPYVP